MASTSEKATPLFPEASISASATAASREVWTPADHSEIPQPKQPSPSSVKAIVESSAPASASKGTGLPLPSMSRAQTCHPLDPLTAAEISVAVATVRAAGATPEVRDSMRFIEVGLVEPPKNVVALADAYFFPPFQP